MSSCSVFLTLHRKEDGEPLAPDSLHTLSRTDSVPKSVPRASLLENTRVHPWSEWRHT
jgi:hypothetical protein